MVSVKPRLEPRMAGGITELLAAWAKDDSAAPEKLMPLVYGELRRLARRRNAGRRQSAQLLFEAACPC